MTRVKAFALLLACYTLIAALRLTAPSDLDNKDQAKQGLYVLDVVQKRSFFLPTSRGIEPATKPPFYNWVAAGISVAWGKVNNLTIRLPAVLSGFGVVLVTFLVGEMLFSVEVGLFAGLVLILNFHFANLSSTARTDMMFCFFISISLLFFLHAYKQHDEKSKYNIFMYVCMGLGTITKGPLAFLLPFLIIFVFLFLRKDLRWLKSMQLGWGVLIWLTITLGWFIPALIKGGREFFNIVIHDEMVNTFFGIGSRIHKTRPFYYLVGHFFGKFLPWSLFVPSAIACYWKFRKDTEKEGLLLPIVWFAIVLVFFSISKGKRSDYILPLYPATAIIVAQFWLSFLERCQVDRWKNHLRMLSLSYLVICFLLVVGLLIMLTRTEVVLAITQFFRGSAEDIELLRHTLGTQTDVFLLTALPLAIVSFVGTVLVFKRNLKALFTVMLMAAGLYLPLYFEILSPDAIRLSGEQKEAFCTRATEKISLIENLEFREMVGNSILFYMGKNVRTLKLKEALELFRDSDDLYLITTKAEHLKLKKQAGFEFTVLAESEYLIRDNRKYVLLGKKKPNIGSRLQRKSDGNP